jgi:RES domain-containing protein
MRFWRIVRRRFAAEAATGDGTRLFGGRWNSRGVRVVYSSTSLALAAIETFVHIEPILLPRDLVSIEGEIPQGIRIGKVELKSLPSDWGDAGSDSLHRFGDDWIRNVESTALLVPSAAIRGEWNLLLNPAHLEFRKIKLRKPEAFEFDARMFR